jgi:hypothetical protein
MSGRYGRRAGQLPVDPLRVSRMAKNHHACACGETNAPASTNTGTTTQ